LKKEDREFFKKCIDEIFDCEKISLMDNYQQHCSVSCLEHSVLVAYISFWFCKKFKIKVDFRSLIRGAMLHDFTLYNWRERPENAFAHLRMHPTNAYNNSIKYFEINEKEKDIILSHMWPLTFKMPKYKESFIVNFADNICAVFEVCGMYAKIFERRLKKISVFPYSAC